MCGISGIINKNNERVHPDEIQVMNDLIKHRGPDGEGFYFGSNFALGHRRLSIIDLSENGAQPMDWNEQYIISFNGEIYNYIELRDRLRGDGYVFNTDSDTEVILAAYDKWAFDCVSKFNGMWAFALYDRKQNILFCSRDRFGIKPYYYSDLDEFFLFGSEIKQILPFLESQKYNRSILLDYLIVGFEEHTNQTFFQNVNKLAPGHNLIYNLNEKTFEIRSYYSIKIDETKKKYSEIEAISDYMDHLEKAVQLRLRSDVKVGTCLSGGLDSSSIAAIASELYRKDSELKFTAIHAKSTDPKTDESEYAKLVAQDSDLELNFVEPSYQQFIDSLDKVIYAQEEPFGSPSVFMQYAVMYKAKELGCKVMLDGQGGDETLLGYEKYYPAFVKDVKGLKKISAFFQSSRNSKLSMKQVVAYFYYFTKYGVRLKKVKDRCSFLRQEILDSYHSDELKKMSASYLNILKLQEFEIKSTQLPHLLRYEDKNSMSQSVETRLPFIDYEVLQTALSLRSEMKIKKGWTKYVLRKVVESKLSAKIVWRKNKLGFNAPDTEWLKNLDPVIKKSIEESKILNGLINKEEFDYDAIDNKIKWRLFNIARWESIYHVQAS